jgi:hypothetical protein
MDNIFPNIMLLSGTGRNVGKTTFVCRLLQHYNQLDIVTVKVSPHWHQTRQGEVLLLEEGRLLLMRETNRESDKDTSRMLRCGAAEVFYLQYTNDEYLLKAFEYLVGMDIGSGPVILETAVLGKYIKPALHLRITRSDVPPSDKPVPDVSFDRLVTFDGEDFDLKSGSICWENNGWTLKVKG